MNTQTKANKQEKTTAMPRQRADKGPAPKAAGA